MCCDHLALAYNKQSTQSDRCKWSPELNKLNNISLFTKPLNFILPGLQKREFASITLIGLFIISRLPCGCDIILLSAYILLFFYNLWKIMLRQQCCISKNEHCN